MSEVIISLAFVGILLLFLHPSEFLMPMTLEASLVILLITTFLAFIGFVWKEHSQDERDELHKLHAGRISFLTGVTIIVIGILVQNARHNVDPWLVAALVIMILTKVLARRYSQIRK